MPFEEEPWTTPEALEICLLNSSLDLLLLSLVLLPLAFERTERSRTMKEDYTIPLVFLVLPLKTI